MWALVIEVLRTNTICMVWYNNLEVEKAMDPAHLHTNADKYRLHSKFCSHNLYVCSEIFLPFKATTTNLNNQSIARRVAQWAFAKLFAPQQTLIISILLWDVAHGAFAKLVALLQTNTSLTRNLLHVKQIKEWKLIQVSQISVFKMKIPLSKAITTNSTNNLLH